jgi:hypothetical protein
MSAGPLRENQEAGDDEDGNHRRGDRAAQVQTALADGAHRSRLLERKWPTTNGLRPTNMNR